MPDSVLFVNFTPITFQGGVERWMLKMHDEFKTHGIASHFICVNESLSNIYAKLVLGREFENRLTERDLSQILTKIRFKDLVPFTTSWKRIRNILKTSEVIYFRLEVLELAIILYFGGFKVLAKSIAGVRSAYYYYYPLTLLDKLHNAVYQSCVIKSLLRQIKRVHVLTQRDEEFFRKVLGITNVVQIPNFIEFDREDRKIQIAEHAGGLNIIFVGELNLKKGIDIVIELIKTLPTTYHFLIAGNGNYSKEIKKFSNKYANVKYWGYLDKNELAYLYSKADMLLLPSRAEGFANVILEALSYGLLIVNSDAVSVNLPNEYEYSIPNDLARYRECIESIKANDSLLAKKLDRSAYCYDHYSKGVIMPQLMRKVFELKL